VRSLLVGQQRLTKKGIGDYPSSLLLPAQPQSTGDEIHLRATVQNVARLTDFSGKITPVDFDPRFALIVRIESVDPAVGSFARPRSLHSFFFQHLFSFIARAWS
jgi:hypothetical protein